MDVVIRNGLRRRCVYDERSFSPDAIWRDVENEVYPSLDLPATVETLLTYLWTFPLISSFVVTFQLSISLVCC